MQVTSSTDVDHRPWSQLAQKLFMSGLSRHMQAAADGPAMVLAVTTAVPPFVHPTSTYLEYYLDMTNCNHVTALKDKFQPHL